MLAKIDNCPIVHFIGLAVVLFRVIIVGPHGSEKKTEENYLLHCEKLHTLTEYIHRKVDTESPTFV
jgi:hypothetical protein